MGFIDRFRSDKKFRFNVILIFVAIVLMAGNTPGTDKKEAVRTNAECKDIAGGDNNFNGADFNACVNGGCYPVTTASANIAGDITQCLSAGAGKLFPGLEVPFMTDCVAQVPNNIKYISLTDTTINACQSASGIKIGSFWCGGDIYQCRFSPDPVEDKRCSSEFQRSLGSILDSFEWSSKMTCKSQFYLVAFGGGLVAFTLMMAAV